eukprot:g1646.t1
MHVTLKNANTSAVQVSGGGSMAADWCTFSNNGKEPTRLPPYEPAKDWDEIGAGFVRLESSLLVGHDGNGRPEQDLSECAPGQYQHKCSRGQYSDIGNAFACTTCVDGKYSIGTGCIDCPPGSKCLGGTEVACSQGNEYQSVSAASTCLTCGTSSYRPGGSRMLCSTKTVCFSGTRVTNAGNATHDRTCGDCDKAQGQYTSHAGQTSCATCANGKYSIGTGCIDCPPGFKCAGGVKVACDQNDEYQSASGASACLTCEASSFFRPGGSRTACSAKAACAAGKHEASAGNATTDRACAECDAASGQYTSQANEQSCSTCAGGTYSIGTGCIDCPPGFKCAGGVKVACDQNDEYQSASGASACLTCEASSFFRPGGSRTTCSAKAACAAGKRVASAGDATTDRACAECDTTSGQYTSQTNEQSCSTCASGTYSIGTGCIDCPPGFKCAGGVKVACDQNDEYQSASGASACLTCEASSFFRPGGSRTTCSAKAACAAGKHEASAGDATRDRTCADCVLGKYQPHAMQSTCLDCS